MNNINHISNNSSCLLINGNKPLFGSITISGAKNAALPILASTLLVKKNINLTNIPKLTDISTMITLLTNLGSEIQIKELQDELVLNINSANIDSFIAPYHIVNQMRASIWVLAPLLVRFGEAKVSLPGGCAIGAGARQVDLHIAILQAMGAEIDIDQGYIHAKIKDNLKSTNFSFNKISVGATITGILAAVNAEGTTKLQNSAQEPEIVDLCLFLNKLGANITGYGTNEITIVGVNELNSGTHRVIPDRIEAGTYMIAAAITKGDIEILGINPSIVEHLLLKLVEAGIEISNIPYGIKVTYTGKLNSVNIETAPYPGFATDLQAQFMSLMSIANGTSYITETIYENRFMHVPELCRMRANIIIKGNTAVINGVNFLSGAEVMASDLRASSSLVLAGLAAKGQTTISRIYHLDRGYQSLEEKLTKCGADIKRIKC